LKSSMDTLKIGVKATMARSAKKDCAEPKHGGIYEKPKRCVKCKLPKNGHSSFVKNCETRVVENIIIRIKVDQGIFYGVARKIFEEKIQASKKTYAEIAGKMTSPVMRQMNCKILRKKG
jgi:hypothetical protein